MKAESNLDPSGRNRKLERVLAAYREADEYDRAPDLKAMTAAHPDLADELAEFFAMDEKIRAVVGDIQSAALTLEQSDGPANAAPGPLPAHGRRVGDYEILSLLDRGGMGIVYRARQLSLKRLVALKMLPGGACAAPEAQRRFQREAEAIAALDHPNIVPVYETGEHDDQRYFSMKLIEGPSLKERLNDYRDNRREAARIVASVARAIHYAHEKGIIHRDLKPANILIDEHGEPLVADFGLALRMGSDTALTRPGWAPGTPSYMSPEQVTGPRDAVGPATDVHALGAILYALLAGHPPFQGNSNWDVLLQVSSFHPGPPSTGRKSIGRDLETICLKCLEKQPSARYPTAEALAEDLDRWRNGLPIQARRAGPIERAWRKARRHPRRAALAGAFVGLLAAVGWSFRLEIRERDRLDHRARLLAENAESAQAARDLAIAWRYRDENRLDPTRRILDRHRPARGALDHRPYPWRLLDRLARVDGRTLLGHKGSVYCAAFSPDGKTVVTAGQDGTIRFWDPLARELLATVPAHSNEVNSVAFSTDGRRLVTASEDQTVKILDVPSRRLLKTLSGHADEVVGAIFTPDGRRLITGARRGKVIVRDTSDWREISSFQAPNTPRLQGLAISPDGSMLAVAGDHGTYVIGLQTVRKRPGTVPILRSPRSKMGLSPSLGPLSDSLALDRRKLAWLGPKDGAVNCNAFSPDGRFLAAARANSSLRVWNVRDWTIAADAPVPDGGVEGGVKGVAFAPDNRTVAAIGELGMVHLLDAITLAEDTIATGQTKSWCVAFSPDGQTLATTSNDSTLRLWSPARDGTHTAVSVPARSRLNIAFSIDGEELTLADDHGGVWACSARDGQLKSVLDLGLGKTPPIVAAALAPDGRRLVAETAAGEYWAWDLEPAPERPGTVPILRDLRSKMGPSPSPGPFEDEVSSNGRHRAGLSVTPHFDWFAVSPDKRWIVGKRSGLDVLPTSANRDQAARHITIDYFNIHGVLFSPTSRVFSVMHERMSSPLLYDIAAGRVRRPTSGIHNDVIVAHAFSRDGARLATGTERGTIVIWDVATLEPVTELPGLSTTVVGLAFSPGGRTLAVGEGDHLVSLWDVPSRRRLTSLHGHSGPVWLVRFSPNGDTLASCATAADGNVQLFLWPAMSLH